MYFSGNAEKTSVSPLIQYPHLLIRHGDAVGNNFLMFVDPADFIPDRPDAALRRTTQTDDLAVCRLFAQTCRQIER